MSLDRSERGDERCDRACETLTTTSSMRNEECENARSLKLPPSTTSAGLAPLVQYEHVFRVPCTLAPLYPSYDCHHRKASSVHPQPRSPLPSTMAPYRKLRTASFTPPPPHYHRPPSPHMSISPQSLNLPSLPNPIHPCILAPLPTLQPHPPTPLSPFSLASPLLPTSHLSSLSKTLPSSHSHAVRAGCWSVAKASSGETPLPISCEGGY